MILGLKKGNISTMGNESTRLSPEETEILRSAESSTRLSRKELLKEYKKFKKQFPDGQINRDQFNNLAGSFLPPNQRESGFVDRLFNAFDNDHSGTVDFSEFMLAMTMCSSDDPISKLRFCFRSLDLDNSGTLDRVELLYAVELIFKHNPGLGDKVAEDVNSPEKVVTKIFTLIDANQDNSLSCEELINFMQEDPKTFSYLGLNLIFLT